MDTRLTERLGIERPVVQAPIGSATCPRLAAAVSEAGGLGMLAVTWRAPDDAREAVRETTRRTDAPVGANVVLDPEASDVPASELVAACLDAGVDIVSLSFGDAAPFVDRIHDEGGVVLQTVGSAEEARAAADAGVDVVVAQGWEAGGHVQSDVATMPLVPRVADAVDVPVVAAGGISDGRGLAAAVTLGADGAWLGTRFLAAEEARVHRAYRRRVVEADETETVYGTPYPDGWPGVPHRVVENETTDRWRAAGRPEAGRPGEGETVARSPDGEPLSRYEDSLAVPGTDGDVTELPLYAGQSVGLTRDVAPAATIVETLVADAEAALSDAHSSVSGAE
ncbi:NAD(P)H-dependent flavin oxidoreductase [Halopelagius longus]|uniref:Nitronate monooxygenase n=1 Tax=Halopelagius longus TaxID=1236180 RepID=A0A1H0XWT9_9EURY|nr:nitronate monooxygenase [Halopelagius longus]RDI73101.1 nitronate monooxygenase [Halopelagius longus]SDQ07116.1 nitronate monooxygenase [Halopelagius longus]